MRALTLLLVPFLLPAATHQVVAGRYYRTFSRSHPLLLRIQPGDIVQTKTLDAAGLDEKGVRRHPEFGNPLTGPFYIEGAQPGDSILVHFRRLTLNRNWGWTGYRLGSWAVTGDYMESVYPNRYKQDLVHPGRANNVPWDIDLTSKTVRLREPQSARLKLEFPAQPMLGCVGVAPEGDFAPTSGPSGNYGGNLDYNRIGEGATVILPVFHPGGLLFFGDGHALQADGEPIGTGVETSFDVEFSVTLRKNYRPSGPRVETADYIISIGSQPEFASSLDRALQLATTDMVRWLTGDYGLEPWAAHLLIGYQGRYDVVTVAGSMALRLPKRRLPVGAAGRAATLDGHRVHYESFGQGTEALVFIHGWTCDLTFWRGQAPVYQKRRSLLIDLPGHGQSDQPDMAYTQELFARAVEAVMRHAGVERATLIGHSMGVPVSLTFVRLFPEKAVALVLVDGGPPLPPKDDAERRKGAEAFAARAKSYRAPDYLGPMRQAIDSMFSTQTSAALRDEIRSKMTSTPQHVVASAMEGMGAMVQRYAEGFRFSLPALAVFAKRPTRSPAYESYLRTLLPNLRSYQEWEGAGHFLMMEQPERFNAALLDFLESPGRP
jgi:acetamidase/formamidase/pimeloyl-ACP methyl ester carboxylesterase